MIIWLAQGGTNRHFGINLNLNSRTIEKHVEQILAKLGDRTGRLQPYSRPAPAAHKTQYVDLRIEFLTTAIKNGG